MKILLLLLLPVLGFGQSNNCNHTAWITTAIYCDPPGCNKSYCAMCGIESSGMTFGPAVSDTSIVFRTAECDHDFIYTGKPDIGRDSIESYESIIEDLSLRKRVYANKPCICLYCHEKRKCY